MNRIRLITGRKRAIRVLWIVIFLLLALAILEKLSSLSDTLVISLVFGSLFVCSGLALYICHARQKYAGVSYVFIFSKEHDSVVEMHLKRIPAVKPAGLPKQFLSALVPMRNYATSIGAKTLSIESPLMNTQSAQILATRAVNRLGGTHTMLKARKLSRIVSILAYHEIHKNDKSKPKLRDIFCAKLTSHGFTILLPN